MMRQAVRMVLAAASLAAAATAASAGEKVVNVYNWSDYIDESVLTDFTKETGIKVVYDVFDNQDIVETKMLAGGSGYDVVVVTGPFLARQIGAGIYQKLDKSKLPNLANMWPDVMNRIGQYDPGNNYGIDYMWGTTGIGYNVEKIKAIMPDAPLDSWDMIFKPEVVSKFKDCGVQVLDASEELIPAALKYLGKNPDSKSTADMEAAGKLLASIKPYIQKFHSSEYINALANGDICLAVGYSGDILQARNRAAEAKNGVEVKYVIPKEGANVVRHHGHPQGCPACRGSPCLHELPHEAGRHRQVVELCFLRQRQPGLAEVHRSGHPVRPVDLSDQGRAGQPVLDHALRRQGPAGADPRLDLGQDRHVS